MFIHEPVDLKYGDLVCETLSSGRTYLTPEGKKYPSITTVLGILSVRRRVFVEQTCIRSLRSSFQTSLFPR